MTFVLTYKLKINHKLRKMSEKCNIFSIEINLEHMKYLESQDYVQENLITVLLSKKNTLLNVFFIFF